NRAVSTTFPKTRKRGYDIDEVEDFLEDARRAYSSTNPESTVVSAESIRTTAFSMRRGGYSTSHVDAALERLEDAFATREREQALHAAGEEAWYQETRVIAQEVVNRLARPKRHRFQRAAFMVNGYRRKDVDELADRILAHLVSGAPLEVKDVRTAAFRPQRGGYREAQVDLLLDSVIDVMLAVR
ncbi:MAG TPA: DivIVA domain-containing protein, partial [Homoserinimonas sp.]|nr:DivIVA domain-containing protein [Homoserinimonas sp.]